MQNIATVKTVYEKTFLTFLLDYISEKKLLYAFVFHRIYKASF